jgi:hypothetical protein
VGLRRRQSPIREIDVGEQPPVDVALLDAEDEPHALPGQVPFGEVRSALAEALHRRVRLDRLRRIDPDQPHIFVPPADPNFDRVPVDHALNPDHSRRRSLFPLSLPRPQHNHSYDQEESHAAKPMPMHDM